MNDRGVFTISIDVELALGTCDRPLEAGDRQKIELEREIIKRLLDLFLEYNIAATWAIVGHLLVTDCATDGGIVHPEITRPISKNHQRDWFSYHPKDQGDPIWYGHDIVQWIKSATPKQEIASHSFSHMIYDEQQTHLAAIESDIKTAKRLHDEWGLPFEVFVFPNNAIGAIDQLATAGVTVYRGNSHRWYHSTPRPIRRLFNFLYFIFAVAPPTVEPTADESGIINFPESMLLLSQQGIRRIASGNLVRMGKAGLDQSVERKEIFHLWFHPSNFAYHTEAQFRTLESILHYAQLLRKHGQLDILTMGQVRKRVPL